MELKHIAPYLPYNLKAEMLDYKKDYVGKRYDEIVGFHQWDKLCKYWSCLTVGGSKPNIKNVKPILRPLSDLIKEIEIDGSKFIPMVKLADICLIDTGKYKLSGFNGAYGIQCDIENDDNNDKHEVLAFDIENGFGRHFRPSKEWGIVYSQLDLYSKLYEWHFDLYDLINQELAIDINTL